jgi:hypothetical protein
VSPEPKSDPTLESINVATVLLREAREWHLALKADFQDLVRMVREVVIDPDRWSDEELQDKIDAVAEFLRELDEDES